MFLNPVAYPGYLNLLRTSHKVSVEVYILDSSRRLLAVATDSLVSGTVDMDAEGSVSRSAKMVLLDPGNRLALDLNGGASGPEFYNRMVQVYYRVTSFSSAESYAVPVFTGPVTDVQRDGVILNLEAKGLEILAQNGSVSDYTWPAGWARSSVIMNALTIATGEMSFADHTGGTQVLRSAWSIEAGDNLWERLKYLAESMGCRLYYDGAGVLQIKPMTTGAVMVFDSTWLTEDPEVAFDIDKIKNYVRVTGAEVPTASGDKTRMYYDAWPSPQHPFSPQSLARNGFHRIIPLFIEDSSLADWGSIIETAWANLNASLMYATEVTAVCSAVPFLEEYDVINISHPRVYMTSPVTKWTLPLVGDAEMSINFFSTSSKGSTNRNNFISNAAAIGGRWHQPGVKHGPSGAFSQFHPINQNGGKTRGDNWYTGENGGKGAPNGPGKGKKNKGKKGKKGNRNRGKGRGRR